MKDSKIRHAIALLVSLTFIAAAGGEADAQRRRRKQRKNSPPPPVAPKGDQEKGTEAVHIDAVHIEVGPAEGKAEVVSLRLEEVVRSALEYSPAVKRARLDWLDAKQDIRREKARYDPIISGSASARSERAYNQFATDAASEIRNLNTTGVQAGLRSWLPSGASYSVTTRVSRVNDVGANPFFTPLTPLWSNELSGRITQPLARGRGDAANNALIDRERASTELRQAQGWELRLSVALRAVASYWTLVLRREELTILETNVADAITLKEIVERRVRAGQDPQSSIVQAAAAIAERLQAVEAARIAIVEAERALLSDAFLADSSLVAFGQVPVPVETVDETIPTFSFQKELAAAFKNRPEAERLRQELKLAKLDRKIASNGVRPQLDLYFTGGLLGLGGTSNVPAADPQPRELLQGGVGASFTNLATFKAPFYEFGVTFEIPLGNKIAKSAYRQSELAVLRVRAQNIETQIALDVRAASQRVRIAARSLNSAKESLRLSEENLKAMKLRYQGGGATLFDVTRSQDEVTQSKARLAVAKAQTAVAKAGLEAAQGTLLQRFGMESRFSEK